MSTPSSPRARATSCPVRGCSVRAACRPGRRGISTSVSSRPAGAREPTSPRHQSFVIAANPLASKAYQAGSKPRIAVVTNSTYDGLCYNAELARLRLAEGDRHRVRVGPVPVGQVDEVKARLKALGLEALEVR